MQTRVRRVALPIVYPFLWVGVVSVIGVRMLVPGVGASGAVGHGAGTSAPGLIRRIVRHAGAIVSAPLSLVLFPALLAGMVLLTVAGWSPRGRAARAARRGVAPLDEATALWIARDGEDRRQILVGLTIAAMMESIVGAAAGAFASLASWRGNAAHLALAVGIGATLLGALATVVFGSRAFGAWERPAGTGVA